MCVCVCVCVFIHVNFGKNSIAFKNRAISIYFQIEFK